MPVEHQDDRRNTKVNLIDKSAIEAFLDTFHTDLQVRKLLGQALVKALSKRPENLAELRELPKDAPQWLKDKWPEGRPYHHFKPDTQLQDQVRHVADWIGAAVVNDADWLKQLDQGKPVRFKKIDSLEIATAEADKDMRIARKAMAEKLKDIPLGEGEKTAMELDNGYRMVRLMTATALDRESAGMGHCIGDGNYDQPLADGSSQFFSLRDAKNAPHATIEVDTKENDLLQCQGKENKPPVAKYLPYLHDFLKDRRYRITSKVPAIRTGLIQVGDAYYDIHKLPENLRVPGDLDLNETSITSLPKGLEVGGSLYLNSTPINTLPEGLKVGSSLFLQDTPITSLQDSLDVGGSLYLAGSKINSLPKGLHVRRDLSLRDTKISSLPQGLKVGGNLLISNTPITSLPEDLVVGGDIHVRGTGVQCIPQTARIGGQVIGLRKMAEKYARRDGADMSSQGHQR